MFTVVGNGYNDPKSNPYAEGLVNIYISVNVFWLEVGHNEWENILKVLNALNKQD